MHRRIGRRRPEPNPEKTKAKEALKLAFKHEVRPEEYLLRVWASSVIVGIYFCYVAATRNGNFDMALLIPFGGWHSHDPSGGVYVETWANIIAFSLQGAFIFWGSILFFLGSYRAFKKDKYVFACFYLASAFIGFALVLPNWTQTLFNMLVEKCPALVQ